jgi:hypothetical protein
MNSDHNSDKVSFNHSVSPDQKPGAVEERELQSQNKRLIILIFIMLFVSLFGAYVWGAFAIITGFELGFIAGLIGLCNGAIAYFFTEERREYLYFTFAIITSFIGYLMAKYIVFRHFIYPLYPDKSPEQGWKLSWDYLSGISFGNIQIFIENWNHVFTPIDLAWLLFMYGGVRSINFINFSNNFTPGRKRTVDRGKFKSRFKK